MATDVTRAVGTVELFGPDHARSSAAVLHTKTAEAADWYTAQALRIRNQELGKAFTAQGFNPEHAEELCQSLAKAIDDFLDAVRPSSSERLKTDQAVARR